jgi:hypothetical protein
MALAWAPVAFGLLRAGCLAASARHLRRLGADTDPPT